MNQKRAAGRAGAQEAMAAGTLGALLESVPEQELLTVDLDFSEMFGSEPGTWLFRFSEPGTAEVFQAAEDAAKLRKQNPMFSQLMCETIAVMALCHVAPESGNLPRIHFYSRLARKNKDIFIRFLMEFRGAFPQLTNFEEAVTEAKNALSETD